MSLQDLFYNEIENSIYLKCDIRRTVTKRERERERERKRMILKNKKKKGRRNMELNYSQQNQTMQNRLERKDNKIYLNITVSLICGNRQSTVK